MTNEDRQILSVASLLEREVIITEKADGSNVCLEREAVFARSHNDAPRHPSFDALKARHAALKANIPAQWQVFGEWLWARHSIAYDRLPDTLLVFGIRDTSAQRWLAWDGTADWCERLGMHTVPVLWRGTVNSEAELRRITERLTNQARLGDTQEGLVVRWSAAFPDSAFALSVAKWVRAGHVQTGTHWSQQQIERNKTAE